MDDQEFAKLHGLTVPNKEKYLEQFRAFRFWLVPDRPYTYAARVVNTIDEPTFEKEGGNALDVDAHELWLKDAKLWLCWYICQSKTERSLQSNRAQGAALALLRGIGGVASLEELEPAPPEQPYRCGTFLRMCGSEHSRAIVGSWDRGDLEHIVWHVASDPIGDYNATVIRLAKELLIKHGHVYCANRETVKKTEYVIVETPEERDLLLAEISTAITDISHSITFQEALELKIFPSVRARYGIPLDPSTVAEWKDPDDPKNNPRMLSGVHATYLDENFSDYTLNL